MLRQTKDWLLVSPLGKTFGFFISVILSGVFSGALITEITIEGNLDWSTVHEAKSFYVLLGLLIVIYVYNRFLYQEEQSVRKFLDNDYCRAYVKSKALPELAGEYRKIIRDRKNIKNLNDWEKELNKILGEE